MSLFQRYNYVFREFGPHDAFCDGDKLYSYNDFLEIINGIRSILEKDSNYAPEIPIGVVGFEDVHTYASIFACWFSGCYFVPLNPAMPELFNQEIIDRLGIRIILASRQTGKGQQMLQPQPVLTGKILIGADRPVYEWNENQVVYILNTSGSTGKPKYVPINLRNLTAYIEGFLLLYPEIGPGDRFLQTYDLTSDGAFTGYLIPFFTGASVYTISQKYFKPMGVAKVLKDKPITWVKLTPSMLACLRPYFSSFNLPDIKYFLFAGEALPVTLVEEWRNAVPNAEISNLYGPTEATVTAVIYKCKSGEALKSKNNIVSIGKPLRSIIPCIQPETSSENGVTGELMIAGDQVMEKYLFSDQQPFVTLNSGSSKERYYPTGDLVSKDAEGYYYYHGRKDDQVKINGYRVDLIEIENIIREYLPESGNVAATAVEIGESLRQLVVFVENYNNKNDDLIGLLARRYPRYKVPERIIGVKSFPLLSSGKTNKKALVQEYLQSTDQ